MGIRNAPALSWSVACALLVSCASDAGVVTTRSPGQPLRSDQCIDLGLRCPSSHDCCSQRCQNGYCEEQNGM